MYRNLQAEIARKGLTSAEIAKRLGMSRNTFSRKLRGKSKFFIDQLVIIKKEFFPECSTDYLFENDEIRDTKGDAHI